MRDTLLEVAGVQDAAVDIDKGLAYVVPGTEFDASRAIAALGEGGQYSAKVQ